MPKIKKSFAYALFLSIMKLGKRFQKKRKKVDDCDEMFTKERCKYFFLTLISFLL